MSPKSKRFTPNAWITRLVPILLAVLLLGLLATIFVVILSLAGVTPGY